MSAYQSHVTQLAELALDEALRTIQNKLKITDGMYASMYFDGYPGKDNGYNLMVSLLSDYICAEINHNMMVYPDEVQEMLDNLNFEIIQTGGGCSAYAGMLGGLFCVIEENLSHELTFSGKVSICLYENSNMDDAPIICFEADNIDDLICKVTALDYKVGTMVKFKNPMPDEIGLKFEIVEFRGKRVLIRVYGDFEGFIVPTQSVDFVDIIRA
jgi:hypothetical protein